MLLVSENNVLKKGIYNCSASKYLDDWILDNNKLFCWGHPNGYYGEITLIRNGKSNTYIFVDGLLCKWKFKVVYWKGPKKETKFITSLEKLKPEDLDYEHLVEFEWCGYERL